MNISKEKGYIKLIQESKPSYLVKDIFKSEDDYKKFLSIVNQDGEGEIVPMAVGAIGAAVVAVAVWETVAVVNSQGGVTFNVVLYATL